MNGCGCQTCVKAGALWKTRLPDRCQKGHIPFLLSISLIHKIIVVLKVQELLAIIAQFLSNSLQGQLSLQTPKQYWARPCLTERLSLAVMTGDDVHFLSHFFFPKLHRLEISHMPPFWALLSENSIVYSTLLNSWSNVITGGSTLYFVFKN
ncbi:hypothetical protein FOCG_03157 [Fusarium oxysporum f. sp. radicis-lycopersici 26381]|jgi:hypothetical protein|uniref:Uncharacterized protein n=1 Tax=Fusarium oxysporum Fo47 TaxID=660027 RepID=W9KJD5_FUSOX|nr:hypothetical protein FOZG_06688 [Fusarium oxysporum Fo47]EXA01525.1 hypothetical protein FOWG_01356 [Fusarium oxysporum f. sp. lycopersici MN25]EXL60208.1 hypothetical protein FOCG_03157 [Fusarium oxysporum f. sp. radicis-lycopersici 26381]KAJ0142003.1 Methylmalonate-semialdehyde dehydrogenase [Fusarium oxysporum f. sp. albedinis]EWZ41374.1 hypothetical protein FOZG_06688 [Fusarium oxysporum Fo47]